VAVTESFDLTDLEQTPASFAALEAFLAKTDTDDAPDATPEPPTQAPVGRPSRPGSLLPLLQDAAALFGEVVQADLTGAAEVLDNGTLLSRAIGTAGEDASASQTVAMTPPGAETSLSTYTLSAGNIITSSDLVADGRFDDEFLRGLGARSAVCVPLRLHDKPLGTLEFCRNKKQAFTPDDVQFLEVVTRQLSTLIRQIRDERSSRAKEQREPRKRTTAKGRGAELRTSPRRKYPYRQLIAPIVGDRLPAKTEFQPICCKDLSGSGFSLYMESPPSFHNLIIALGLPPHVKFFRAEVMRVQPEDHEGRKVYLVGCRLKVRVYL
jgi:hypothetical protein